MNSPNDENRPLSTAELYKDSTQELRSTLENILSSHEELNQRAIDLARIDLLSASVIVTGISLNGLKFSVVLLAGFISFLYAIWCCAQIYQPREFDRGISRDGGIAIDKEIKSGITPTEHYRKLLYSYVRAVEIAREQAMIEKEIFQRGLWSSVAAILFFAVAGVIHVIDGFPWQSGLIAVVVIPIVTIWGKDKVPE